MIISTENTIISQVNNAGNYMSDYFDALIQCIFEHSSWVLFAETVSAAKILIAETVSVVKILFAETLFWGHFGAFFGDQMLIQRGDWLVRFG